MGWHVKEKNSMSAHQPILPIHAIELVQAKNLESPEKLLADFAAAGLIKTYALVREIRPEGEPSVVLRGSQIPAEEWERIVISESVQTAMNGGTVRLEGNPFKGGQPSVQITGISFSPTSLVKVLDRYCAASPINTMAGKSGPQAHTDASEDSAARVSRARAVKPIMPGDLTVSINQVMAATGLGRTKINQLIRNKVLEHTKVGRRTLISVKSLEEFVGQKIPDLDGN